MKELIGVAVALALLIGVSALAVGPFHDRELFVSPPDAVAEGFAREVACKRWPRAKEYLADPESRSQDELRRLQKELGEGENIETAIVRRDETRAVVTVRVPSRNVVKSYSLTFDREWKIE